MIAVTVILALSLYFLSLRDSVYQEVTSLLKSEVYSIELYLSQQKRINPNSIQYFQSLASKSQNRITVINEDGRVFFDSSRKSLEMDNHLNRPEVLSAKNGEWGSSKRYSQMLGAYFLYVARAVEVEEKTYFVRVAREIRFLNEGLNAALWKASVIGLALFLFFVGLLYFLLRAPMRGIEKVTKAAQYLASGQYDVRVPTREKGGEVNQLGEAMNSLAESLEEKGILLQDSEKKFFDVLNSLEDGLVLLGQEGEIEFCNKQWKSNFKLHEVDQKKSIFQLLRNAQLMKMIKSSQESSKLNQGVIEFHQKDQKETYFIQAFPVLLNDKTLTVVTMSNLTLVRRAEDLKKDFVANASHQLKTPLAAIRGYADLLVDIDHLSQEKKASYVKKIGERVDMANNMIVRLMMLTKIEKYEHEKNIEEFDLKSCINSIIENHETEIEKKGLKVKLEFSKSNVNICSSKEFFQMAINAVFENAVLYSHLGGEVILSCEERGDEVLIQIQDQGIGIDEQDQGNVFERFFRSNNAQEHYASGTGIGLALARQCMRIVGGDIALASAPGSGALFTLCFPNKLQGKKRKNFTETNLEDS